MSRFWAGSIFGSKLFSDSGDTRAVVENVLIELHKSRKQAPTHLVHLNPSAKWRSHGGSIASVTARAQCHTNMNIKSH